jgi:phage tail protein X
MPVVVCRGDDATYGVCSSHVLHAVMIATDMQRTYQGAVTPEEQERAKMSKCLVLNEMQEEIRRTLLHAGSEDNVHTYEQCYEVIGQAIRKYWALYAHKCTDVRMHAMDSVLACDTVYTHMLSYVSANLGVEPGAADMQSYYTLLRFWIRSSFIDSE